MTEFDAEFHGPTGPTPEKAAIASQDRARSRSRVSASALSGSASPSRVGGMLL